VQLKFINLLQLEMNGALHKWQIDWFDGGHTRDSMARARNGTEEANELARHRASLVALPCANCCSMSSERDSKNKRFNCLFSRLSSLAANGNRLMRAQKIDANRLAPKKVMAVYFWSGC
jgi:hypothetical protein